MATIEYRFLPWARRGLARAITAPDVDGQEARPAIQLGLTIAADRDGTAVAPVSGPMSLKLFSAADVVGIDTRLMVRTDPKPFATNFEPNYLALVDFDPPDFPWMFTPAQASAGQRLRPWLVLVVFDRAHVGLPRMRSGAPLPVVIVPQAVAPKELPNLDESWMWAHAQATSAATTQAQIEGELLQRPETNVSRLISPRRLEPSRDYFACLVPAFDVGRRRGLNERLTDAGDGALLVQPAWTRPFNGDVKLPVYYHWEFSTGPAGDFETLARRIKTPRTYPSDANLTARLKTLGTVPISVDADRLLTADAQPIAPLYEGALTAPDFVGDPQARADVAGKLQTIVNAPQTQLVSAAAPERAPTVAPPIYGAWHARKHVVSATPGRWLNDLNRDPRFRAAAGKGTEVVRVNQEAFMDACWGQVGEVLRTERALARAALAKEVQRVLHAKLKRLPDDRFLAVTGQALSRIRLGPQETVLARIRITSLPNAFADPALRRLTSAQRPTLKAAVRRAGGTPVSQQIAGMAETLVKAVQHPEAIDPNRFVPDGILGSRSFDRLQVPDDPRAMVDLGPMGLQGEIRADTLKAMQTSGKAARAWYAKQAGEGAAWRPTLKPVRPQGLLTDLHFIRFAQLASAAPQRIALAEIARQVQATPDVRRSEGLLIALSDTAQGTMQSAVVPLRIDARTGAIAPFAAVPRAAPPAGTAAAKTRASRTPRAAALQFATVAKQQVSQFGHTAVFATLPVNALPATQDAVPVAISSAAGSALAGLFTGGAAALPPGVATITVPPPLTDRETMTRFGTALKEFNRLWWSPLDVAGVKVKPVNFPLASVSAEIRRRTDPELTVPARLAATLSIGGSALVLDAATRTLSNPHVSLPLARDAAFGNVRFVMPRLFDRVMAYPKLEAPMSERLAAMDAEAMMPGANAIPNDFLVLARTNNRFVESFMVGANHEMARELLWRGFPTDQRGTPMRHFWDRLDDAPDIPELHLWNPAQALGKQPPPTGPAGNRLVLVIRASLIRRFPNLTIYARRRKEGTAKLAVPGDFTAPEPGVSIPATLDMITQRPVFAGPLPPDLVYVGFDIVIDDPATARDIVKKWCFVLEEPMTEPRFGFDEPDSGRTRSAAGGGAWKDVTWPQVLPASPPDPFLRLDHLVSTPAGAPARAVSLANTAHAADVARALLQRPFRAYYLGTDLMPQAS